MCPQSLPTMGKKEGVDVEPGTLVFAKMPGFPWWPAVVFPDWKSVDSWEIR